MIGWIPGCHSVSRENVSRFPDYLLVETVSRNFEMSDDGVGFRPERWATALELCHGPDLDDAPIVAITLALDGLRWTGEGRVRRGLAANGFDRFFTPRK